QAAGALAAARLDGEAAARALEPLAQDPPALAAAAARVALAALASAPQPARAAPCLAALGQRYGWRLLPREAAAAFAAAAEAAHAAGDWAALEGALERAQRIDPELALPDGLM